MRMPLLMLMLVGAGCATTQRETYKPAPVQVVAQDTRTEWEKGRDAVNDTLKVGMSKEQVKAIFGAYPKSHTLQLGSSSYETLSYGHHLRMTFRDGVLVSWQTLEVR